MDLHVFVDGHHSDLLPLRKHLTAKSHSRVYGKVLIHRGVFVSVLTMPQAIVVMNRGR